MLILTCKLGNEIINCYDGTHDKEQLKKWASKKILLCSVCGKPYEYCHGKVKTPYFRHMDKTECEDKYKNGKLIIGSHYLAAFLCLCQLIVVPL